MTSLCGPSWQCADDPDAVCTRSVTIRLPNLHSSLVKLKHGGGVSMDGQDVQMPLLQGVPTPPPLGLVQLALQCPFPSGAHCSPLLWQCQGSLAEHPWYVSVKERKVSWRRRRSRGSGLDAWKRRKLLQAWGRAKREEKLKRIFTWPKGNVGSWTLVLVPL